MNGPPVDVGLRLRVRERVVVHVDSVAARWIGALALFCAACWLVLILARHHHNPEWHCAGRLGWSLTVLAAVALIARGIFLGRPVTATHAAAAALCLLAGLAAHVLAFDLLGDVLIAGSGLVLMRPTSSRAATRRSAAGVGIDQCHHRGSVGAVRHADRQGLPLQRRRDSGAGIPGADGLCGGRRRPDRRRGAIPRTGRRFRGDVSHPRLADRGGGVQRAAAAACGLTPS